MKPSTPSSPIEQKKLDAFRAHFPALHQQVNGKDLVYLDNAATSFKPNAVIEALTHHYKTDSANVHRGLHTLSQRASEAYEKVRLQTQRFIHAKHQEEITFVKGTTEAINLVAHSFLEPRLNPSDEILITELEHHANIVPWQIVAEKKGAKIVVVPVTEQGEIDEHAVAQKITSKTKMLSLAHVSNTLGTILPIEEIIALAKSRGIPVLIDGAQAIRHLSVDVQKLDCDFYAFSGHKMYGPTGIGVLYGKKEHLEVMEPYQGGGAMIRSVSFEKTTFHDPPFKFEAGTPHIAGAIGLGSAIQFIQEQQTPDLVEHEEQLTQYALTQLKSLPFIQLIGQPKKRVGVFSFVMDHAHPQDIGTILDMQGIAVRTGHHCTQPLLNKFGVESTARASLAAYNTFDEIDRLIAGLKKVHSFFS